MSGLNAAQAALNTASNNISSYNVAGYTRQTTIMAQANSTLGAGGWVGNGVYVSGVQREYDAFITNQLRAAQTQSSGLTARYEQMSKIDNMLSTSTSSLATQMQDFFTSLQTLVSNAEDPAARQALIGKSEGLVNQFKTTDQYLRDQDKQVNIAIGASVDQINNYAKQIASLNDQISRLTGVGAGASPNNLLDQRDQLVSELNQIVGVEVSVQDGGTYNITMANGYSLVQGSTARQLAAVPSSAAPSRTTVAYVDGTAGNIEIPEKLLNTGSLGGILTFRSQDLDQTRNTLGQLALAFAEAFNTQHKAVLITGCMCFVRKLPLMCPFYKHSAVRVGFGHRFLNRSSSGTSLIFVIIVIVDFLTQFFSFLGYLFAKLFLVHLRGFGDLFLLELLFIRGCFNMCSVDKNHAWVYHPVVQCFVQNMCKNFFTQLRGKAFAKGITYRCKVRNLFQQAISEKPTVCYVYLYIPVRLT